MKKGSRVKYTSGWMPKYTGRMGVVTRHRDSSGYVMVLFDGETQEIVIDPNNLELEINTLNPKDKAVKRFGEAQTAVSLAEKEKKSAKKALSDLGLITDEVFPEGDSRVIFEGSAYKLIANTAKASTRISAESLYAALTAEKLSQAAIRRILDAASVANKAAVSYTVAPK